MNLYLVLLVWLSQAADVWSTNKVLKLPGGVEKNVLVAKIMSLLGKSWWLCKTPAPLFWTYLAYKAPEDTLVMSGIVLTSAYFFYIANRNWRIHQKHYNN